MKGFSTVKLIIILGLLVGVYMLVNVFNNKSRSESLRDSLVEINKESVTGIKITSSEEVVELIKEDDQWMVILSNKKVKGKASNINDFLNTLETIEPGAIASKKKEKWSEYQVDSSGTRIEIMEGSSKTLDIVIGKFNVTGQRSYNTYVKLYDDDAVYTADNFMGMSLSRKTSGFRENLLFKTKRDSVSSIVFNYPDSAFTLSYDQDVWNINGVEADSTSITGYLSGLGFLSSTQFNDEVNFNNPQLEVVINTSNESYQVQAMSLDTAWLIHSPSNPDGYFVDEQLFNKVFKGSAAFLK